MMNLDMCFCLLLGVPLVAVILVVLLLRYCYFPWRQWQRRGFYHIPSNQRILAFFHPYCDNGGGGERVLWVAIHALLQSDIPSKTPLALCIYTGDIDRSKDQILTNVEKKFGLQFSSAQSQHIHMVYIHSRTYLEAKWYPVATMICQSFASMFVVLECMYALPPDLYVDSMGAPFTYFIVKCFSFAKVLAYVHYPIISEDMLHAVREQRPSYNNDVRISSHVTVSKLKLLYYQGFASLFYLTGLCTDMVCVNSSWTLAHIKSLWKMQFKSDDVDNEKNMQKTTTQLDRRRLTLVYPPCNTSHLQHYKPNPDYEQMLCKLSAEIPSQQKVTSSKVVYDGVRDSKEEILQSLAKKTLIISIGQFRPEKDHMLQVRIMEEFLKKQQPSSSSSNKEEVMLVMLGSTRHEEDEALVRQLQAYIEAQSTVTLALAQHVHIYTNLPYDMLTFVLFQSRIGLHTMWNEHFGISVVEMMAAGLLMIAHNSGGPKADIVQHGQNGYLATAPEEYADIIVEILKKHPEENRSIQEQAKISATRYSDEVFASKMNHEFSRFLAL